MRTSQQGALSRPARAVVTLLAKTLGTPPERAVTPLVALLDDPPVDPLTMVKGDKRFPVSAGDDDHADADRLYRVTEQLLAPR